MPMLADIDDPPRSRLGGLALGMLVGLPVVGLVLAWFIPALVSAVLGGAQGLDNRLQQQEAYIEELCGTAFASPRDDDLCNCAWAVEFPALDCQDPFRSWAIERASTQCASDELHRTSLSYCSCIEVLAGDLATAPDDAERRRIAQGYDRCVALPDAAPLPSPSLLVVQN